MISKQQQKYVQSLHNKKYRNEYGLFLVEGEKNVMELLHSYFEIQELFCSGSFAEMIDGIQPNLSITIGNSDQIASISTQKNQSSVVAVVKKRNIFQQKPNQRITLILDDINDPGNLGTIVRIADWYGLNQIICSENTVDFYNPKVIAATMGSFCRVECFYTNLSDFLSGFTIPILGAFLEGESVHDLKLDSAIGVVIGSESHGISNSISALLSKKITIPGTGRAESLNAAVATGIILDNLLRTK